MKETIDLIDKYWKFDEDQQPLSSWHDKQELLKIISNRLEKPVINFLAEGEMKYKKRYFKKLCEQCNLDNDCYCQNKSQKSVDNCGMDNVMRANKEIQKDIQAGRFTPDKDYFGTREY